MKANFNINLTTLILIILIVLGIGYYRNTVNDLKNQVTEEVKLSNALLDTTRTYRNKNNELVSEKLTLQASLERLKDENLNLSESQRELLRRIDEMGREKEVIAAALIKTEIRLDSLLNIGGVIDTTTKKVDFYENSDTLIYHISVRDVYYLHFRIKDLHYCSKHFLYLMKVLLNFIGTPIEEKIIQ